MFGAIGDEQVSKSYVTLNSERTDGVTTELTDQARPRAATATTSPGSPTTSRTGSTGVTIAGNIANLNASGSGSGDVGRTVCGLLKDAFYFVYEHIPRELLFRDSPRVFAEFLDSGRFVGQRR